MCPYGWLGVRSQVDFCEIYVYFASAGVIYGASISVCVNSGLIYLTGSHLFSAQETHKFKAEL